MRPLYQCWRCGYHYGARQLVIEPGRLYPVCADRKRCDQHIRTRERDGTVRVIRR